MSVLGVIYARERFLRRAGGVHRGGKRASLAWVEKDPALADDVDWLVSRVQETEDTTGLLDHPPKAALGLILSRRWPLELAQMDRGRHGKPIGGPQKQEEALSRQDQIVGRKPVQRSERQLV